MPLPAWPEPTPFPDGDRYENPSQHRSGLDRRGLFAWAMAMKMPVHAAALSGTAAAAFMYGGFVFNDRLERRESQARRMDDDEELS